jgi:hypothetical protein
MGWDIVRHSFSMLFRNIGNALRISIGPILLALVVSVAIVGILQINPARIAWELSTNSISGNTGLAILLLLLLYIFVSAWIAVAWHRFILLEDYPGLLPAVSGRPIMPYIGKTLLLGLVMMLALIPALLVIGLLSAVFDPTSGLFSIIGIGLMLYFSYMWLRFGLVLPATAVGRPMGVTEAWRATAPHANAILGTGALLIVINAGASVVSAVMPQTVALVLDLVVSWITLMIGTSVLTTLYGVIVERRTLG